MGKHLGFKAFVLLVVIFFHSFVLVPKAHASVNSASMFRIAFRSVAPSVIAGIGSMTSLVIGIPLAVGVGYLIYKSGAITAIKTWWTNNYSYPPPSNPQVNTAYYTNGGWKLIVYPGPYVAVWNPGQTLVYSSPNQSSVAVALNLGYAWILANGGASEHWATTYVAPPSSPYDVTSTPIGSPTIASNTVYATPGAGAALSTDSVGTTYSTISDAAADVMIAGLGATAVNPTTGVNALPQGSTATDNNVSMGESQSIGILAQIMNYVSSLLGIKTATESMKNTLDNSLIIQQQMSAKLDNVGGSSFPQAAQSALDNIAVGIQNQTAILDGVETKIEHLDNTVSQVSATSSSVVSRIDALKTAVSTKFPFSLASSLSVATVSGASTYDFAPLPLTPTISIPINPMAGPLAGVFTWARQLLVWFLWAGTLFAILRKAMEM